MQAIAPVTVSNLLTAGQESLIKLESYVAGKWIDYTDLPMEALLDGELEHWTATDNLTYWIEDDGGTVGEGTFRESTTVHSLAYSARILTTIMGDWAAFYQDITLTVGINYTISLWYLREAHASSELRLYITDPEAAPNIYLKADGTWQAAPTYIDLTTSAIWKYFSLAFTPHPDYTNYRVRFYKSHFAGGAVSYYVDDVSVAETLGKNYLQSANVSLGGAKMTPNPVEGTWGATLLNIDGVFHPQHSTCPFRDILKTERLTRLSIGATYGGTDYYWQRVIGYMNEPKFSAPDYNISINGGDYMKRLRETELRSPDNYWGSSATFSSIASDGMIGAEIYAENDAMEIGGGEANNVANWVATDCVFVSFADVTGGSNFVGKLTNTPIIAHKIINANIGNVTAGTRYRVAIKYMTPGATEELFAINLYQASGLCGYEFPTATNTWQEASIVFTALDTGALEMRVFPWLLTELRIDQISIKQFVPYWERYYALPGASTGPYYVTLDGDPAWQGEGDEDWKYVEDAEAGPDPPAHPAKIVYFNINKTVANGVNNLIVYYFTQQVAENVVADLLVLANLYVDQAAALAAMQFDATGVTIDMTWFRAGTTCLNAIKKICERCDYRFYFRYDGVPFFKPKPAAGAAVFTFTDPKQITSISTYQDRSEIKNRIVIKGLKLSDTVGKEETMPSDLTGEDSDPASIAAYGERTLTIDNHLFQTQASIDAMCTSLLAEYKDPKWYSTLKLDFNPVPLELGDNIQWEARLSPTLNITQTGIIRDTKITKFNTTYKCVQT